MHDSSLIFYIFVFLFFSIIVESVVERCVMIVATKNQAILSWGLKIQFVCVRSVMKPSQMMSKYDTLCDVWSLSMVKALLLNDHIF